MRPSTGKRLWLYLLLMAVTMPAAGIQTHPARAISLNPADYFTYSYSIEFDSPSVTEGEVFYAHATGEAECIRDAPVHPTEARIRGRVMAEHLETGRLVSLNSGYSISISPVPSVEGETVSSVQDIPLYFPWDSPAGAYRVTGELIEASFKAVLWFDATGYFPAIQPMGDISYDIEPPQPEPVQTEEPDNPVNYSDPEPPIPEPTASPVPGPHPEPVPPSEPSPEPTQEPTPQPVTTVPVPDPVPAIPEGAASLSGKIDENGLLAGGLAVFSSDGLCRLDFEPGAAITGPDGQIPLWFMLSRKSGAIEAPGVRLLGPSYSFSEQLVFEPSACLSIGYYRGLIPEGMNENVVSIGRWNEQSSEWVVLAGCLVNEDSGTVSANIDGTGTYCALAPVSPLAFNLSGFSIIPREAHAGEMITIQCTVSNSGSTAGVYEAVLKLNGDVAEIRRMELDGGKNRIVTFGIVRNGTGVYEVDLNGLAGSFKLSSLEVYRTGEPPETLDETQAEKADTFSWLPVIYSLNGCLLVALLWLGRKALYRGCTSVYRNIRRLF